MDASDGEVRGMISLLDIRLLAAFKLPGLLPTNAGDCLDLQNAAKRRGSIEADSLAESCT